MLRDHKNFIRHIIEASLETRIGIEETPADLGNGLHLWFDDTSKIHSPIVELTPKGLHRYCAKLIFGEYAGEIKRKMQSASGESADLATKLLETVPGLSFDRDPTNNRWDIANAYFNLSVDTPRSTHREEEEDQIASICQDILIPILGATMELIGTKFIDNQKEDGSMEGAVKLIVIKRRERSRQNRVLCLRIHGQQCNICSAKPKNIYGDAGDILEVHHLQPLAEADGQRLYDPSRDLIPLCPNCHRAVHTKRPIPWAPEEIKSRMARHG